MTEFRSDPSTARGRYPADPQQLLARAQAIEALLKERGALGDDTVARIVAKYESEIGPLHGARVVARAWVDPAFRQRLLADASAACGELGIGGLQGERMVALADEDDVHHVIVCTLCSCYPWPVLGLPPGWYKSPQYRSRVVAEPRAVLAEFGLTLPDTTEIRVTDSTAEVRYFVLPLRPAGTQDLDEKALAALVTRDCLIGVALPRGLR
ncbi:nitrile hydratase subunit alpha [Actinopolymorpha pittospori]